VIVSWQTDAFSRQEKTPTNGLSRNKISPHRPGPHLYPTVEAGWHMVPPFRREEESVTY
jgi:hypothetical protein